VLKYFDEETYGKVKEEQEEGRETVRQKMDELLKEKG